MNCDATKESVLTFSKKWSEERPAVPELTRREFAQGALALCASLWLPSVWTKSATATLAAPEPGTARVLWRGRKVTLFNEAVAGTWDLSDGVLRAVTLENKVSRTTLPLAEAVFGLMLRDGRFVSSTEMRVAGSARVESLKPRPQASRLAERIGGKQISVDLASADKSLIAHWRAILRDGSHYLRQELTLETSAGEYPISEVRLIDLMLPGARVSGTAKGSPVVAPNFFLGFEHPLSLSRVEGDRVKCALSRELPLRPGQRLECSAVLGATSSKQLRRDFLNYLERERAHPYRTFLHYNSWYDLGYFTKFDEAGALQVIETYGRELVQKRGVKLNSFLFDDGWDDPQTLWHFHSGFPNGFAKVSEAAANYGAAPGVWMSPWGGYGKPKQERLKFGKEVGFEINEGGFALSGPVYYRRFRETCLEMIRRYGVNQFKFDGTGNANRVIAGSEFGSDFEAAINLISELRREKPDLFVNLTTGTYPSPFWLRYCDSIWRGGEDHSFAGVGSKRQQWITYRDANTYQRVVKRGPLYPLNALMLHGLIYAQHAKGLETDPQRDFPSEIRAYFGSGTQLQEMYVTPSLLTNSDWDTLAEAANWSRRNADVLGDTHWLGGDPAKLEVYGWASWSPRKAILVLRNPSDRAQSITIDPVQAFELPEGAARNFALRSPWIEDRGKPTHSLRAGEATSFELQPFQVMTLEATPISRK